jgi:hypothetical protein
MFLHPALHSSRKISMVSTMKTRRFSGTLVVEEYQSVIGAKTRQPERLIILTAQEQE